MGQPRGRSTVTFPSERESGRTPCSVGLEKQVFIQIEKQRSAEPRLPWAWGLQLQKQREAEGRGAGAQPGREGPRALTPVPVSPSPARPVSRGQPWLFSDLIYSRSEGPGSPARLVPPLRKCSGPWPLKVWALLFTCSKGHRASLCVYWAQGGATDAREDQLKLRSPQRRKGWV
ncbi:hypothetical protein Cadr_000029423 [Camelus dromedarius]|uniref:Uncharacterized protein n=1 Tax=Camelus dromedarius TaxID=9838 RepID=A0A5N4C5Q5_CAMDR|nr:hypothetical protein Cadr_000029423 [Camelus dromedarius]